MALLPRKIFFELVGMTLLGLVGISLVMTLALAMVEAGRRGMDPLSILTLMPYMIPTLLPYTIPVCLLYACVVVYGGMSSSNEIVAVKAAGVNVMRVVQPAIFLGVGAAVLGLFITDRVIPKCNLRLRQVLLSDLETAVLAYLKNNNGRLTGDGASYEIAVADIKGNRLINPIIVRKNSFGETIANTKADEAVLRVVKNPIPGEPPQINVTLLRGVVQIVKGDKGSIKFDEETFPLPVPVQMWKMTELKLECLSYRGCWDRSRELAGKASAFQAEQAWRGAVSLLNGAPLAYAMKIPETNDRAVWREATTFVRKSRDAIGEMHIRGNNSLAGLSFILLGCPVSILLTRKDPLQTFFLCFAPIILIYYPSILLTFNIFKEGVDDASYVWGQALMWAPSAGMLLAAAAAIRKLVRS